MKRKSKFREYAETIISAFCIAMVIRTFVIQAFKIPTGSMEPTLHGDPRHGDRIFVNKFIYRFKNPKRGDIIVFTTRNIVGLDRRKDYIKRLIGLPGESIEIRDGNIYINGQLIAQPEIAKNTYINSMPSLQMLDVPKKGIVVADLFFLVWAPDMGKFYLLNSAIYKLPLETRMGDKFTFDPQYIEFMEELIPFQTEFLASSGQYVEFRKDGLYIDNVRYKENYTMNGLYTILGQYGFEGRKIRIPEGCYFALGDNSYNSKDSRYWGFVPERNIKGEAMFIWWPPKRWQIVR